MASFRPEVLVSGEWASNALRFATREEAERSARHLFMRWFACSDSRAAASDDAITHVYTADDRLVEFTGYTISNWEQASLWEAA